MTDTDWREILSFSQKDLKKADKEILCESLSWMEADDIELNFTDLKTLFRLAQDILKYKSEQVNNLLGQLETSQRKSLKSKSKTFVVDSPVKSSDSILETIAHQEEVIKANKEILEQLYTDIAELESRKNKIEEENHDIDKQSESSRDALSEMNAMAQLENEITVKNRHIRKLLADVKMLEEDNTKLKEKVTILKEKLTEATKLIENFTEQLLTLNNETSNLKDILGSSEETKAHLSAEVESLRKKLFENDHNMENAYEKIKLKLQHWKNIAREKKSEIEKLVNENTRLKEREIIIQRSPSTSPKKSNIEEQKIKELQDKLSEASKEITQSAKVIELLKSENKQLKSFIEEIPDSVSELKNESDDGKERVIINKLKKKVKMLTIALQEAEEMTSVREKELTEITSQLQLIQSEEGIKILLEGMKDKKKQLKFKDEGIKSLVQEVNILNQLVDGLQLENETMRQRFNIPKDENIPTKGILKKFHDVETKYLDLTIEAKELENKLVTAELQNYNLKLKNTKLVKALNKLGQKDNINETHESSDSHNETVDEELSPDKVKSLTVQHDEEKQSGLDQQDLQAIIEENEGLRKGLEDILNFLKDNSTTSSGVLMLQCPSLEALLRTMEARHTAGWFAPHMATVLELRAALGGKDALLTALHEARKETFHVMGQLEKEIQKSSKLEQKLHEMESTPSNTQEYTVSNKHNVIEFGPWMSDKEINNIDLFDKAQIENMVAKGNIMYEEQLKKSLSYFHDQFKMLFDKMTSTTIQATDDFNKWSIQEEQYKAEIENLNAQLFAKDDEDISDDSPGLIQYPSTTFLQRKCSFLEDSYKYIRTLNENMKNEILQCKKDILIIKSEFETKIQRLILSASDLSNKLRSSIPLDLFWRQNMIMNDTVIKYRKILNDLVKKNDETQDLFNPFADNKLDVLNTFQREIADFLRNETKTSPANLQMFMNNIVEKVTQKHVQQMCVEIQNKNKEIAILEARNIKLQEKQAKLVDETLSSATKQETDLMREQLQRVANENKILKEQCQHVESQLNIALLQLEDSQHRQFTNDMEINMLRHQILDLQSTSDNKAILAKLSGELLVAHLQTSEGFKKIEGLNTALKYEKQLRAEAEEMLNSRQKIFDVYSFRYESKFRYMYDVMQILRQQYQGSTPTASIENYLNNIEDVSRKTHAVNEKLLEIEDLQSKLMIKHAVYDQVLDLSKNKCVNNDDSCPHKLKMIIEEGLRSRELEHFNKKITILEQSREELIIHYNNLEKTLVLVSQGFQKPNFKESVIKNSDSDTNSDLEMEDILSDDDGNAKRSQTVSLKQPKVLKSPKDNIDMTKARKEDTSNTVPEAISKISANKLEVNHAFTQTILLEKRSNKINSTQTDEDKVLTDLKHHTNNLTKDIDKKNKELSEATLLAQKRAEDILSLNTQKSYLDATIQNLRESNAVKDKQNEKLQNTIENLKRQLNDCKSITNAETKSKEQTDDENKYLLLLKQLEVDKNTIVTEYKELLKNEREEYSKSINDFNMKVMELQAQLDSRGNESDSVCAEAQKEVIIKYTINIRDLQDKCFKLESELDGRKTELSTYQSEVNRWKNLASERLLKMEQLNSQLEQRHCQEVESYKAENQHWLSQLNDTQREHMELRTRISEQKTSHIKQLADKDVQIEQLRSMVQNLKAQIINMQTMISINDPSFDLSAIVEVEETSDAMSQQGSDRLELKFDSTVDFHDGPDDIVRMPATSTSIWQEPLVDRLRREKNLTSKQNVILRRQIKALAARERRARLDAQNLKSQVYRINTSGSKLVSSETAGLHNKIAALQSQLTSARRDTQSSISLWDKWKRAQQAAERWQARYEEKFQETKKLESSLNLAKSAVTRLEKEKRVLLTRLSEIKNENILAIEKQESEVLEKCLRPSHHCACSSPPPVSERALLDRVQAQQRRIVALEVAEKGNEYLVSEYEKALAEITSLKGQVLKLESTLLESQIRSPLKSTAHDSQPELDHWKSYCEMLKEENVQLTLRVNALETTPATSNQQRVNDLEQTVLTLRSLVSKLQAEQKSLSSQKRIDSRPSSGRSVSDRGPFQGRSQSESLRIEIANLKRSIMEKDLLLEKSKEMLKIAAEREEELLRENAFLRRRIDEFTRAREGFLSV